MKKHFFYFLLTAFVFNFLLLNNFTLAQTREELCYGCQVNDIIGITPSCQILEKDSITPDTPDDIQCCTINENGIVIGTTSIENCAIGGLINVIQEAVENALKALIRINVNVFLAGIILIVNIIAFALWGILMLPLIVSSYIIDFVSNLNPFEGNNAPGMALWNALKTWGYIILTFVGLYAGFQWLFGEDTKAKKLIFNILLVALLINFTFLFVKEAFNIVWNIEKGVSSGSVGEIFRDAAVTTSPWSLANAIQAGNKMPGGVDPRGNFIDVLVQNLMGYITSTINDIFSNEIIFNRLITTVFASFLSIVFTFITLLITVIAMSLYVVRYLVIAFLAGISSIAVASNAFPEIRVGNKNFKLNLFDQWFSYFVKWILVIPVFLILFLVSNNALSLFLSTGGAKVGSFPELAQLVFSLIIIIGSFLLSIIFAEELTGKASSLAKNLTIGLSTGLGGLAVNKALKLSGNKAADILEKTGGKIAESPLPMSLRARGIQLQEEAEKLRRNVYEKELKEKQAVSGYYLGKFRGAATDQERREALKGVLTLIEREQNPWTRTNMILGLNLSDKDIEKILTDGNYADEARRILSLMGSREAPRESRERLAKIFKSMPTKKLLLASMNQALYETWDALHAEVQKNFLEAIKDLKKEDLIEEFAKLNIGNWQAFSRRAQSYPNIYQHISKSYNEVSDNAFVGFVNAVVNNDISTLRGNIEYYPEIFRYLDRITGLTSPNTAKKLLEEGLNRAPGETIDNFFPIWLRLKNQNRQLAKEIQQIIENFYRQPGKPGLFTSDQKTKIYSILSVKI